MLLTAGIALFVLAGWLVWWTAKRLWHLPAIAVLTVALFHFTANYLTGDLSRYLPHGVFADGAAGKDQIALASGIATILLSIILASALWLVIERIIALRRIRIFESWRKG